MDLNAPTIGDAREPSTMIDTALRIGLVAILVYACARIVLPFAFILIWSAILGVMLYPLHLRLATWLGDRGSALLIGLIGVAVILGPMVIVVTSLATSLYSLISSLQSQDLTLPPPPLWLDGTPLVGKKLTEIWTLVATNLPAALTKYGHLMSGPAGMAGVVRRRPGPRRTIVRSFIRDRRRARRLWPKAPPTSLDACWNASPAARSAGRSWSR